MKKTTFFIIPFLFISLISTGQIRFKQEKKLPANIKKISQYENGKLCAVEEYDINNNLIFTYNYDSRYRISNQDTSKKYPSINAYIYKNGIKEKEYEINTYINSHIRYPEYNNKGKLKKEFERVYKNSDDISNIKSYDEFISYQNNSDIEKKCKKCHASEYFYSPVNVSSYKKKNKSKKWCDNFYLHENICDFNGNLIKESYYALTSKFDSDFSYNIYDNNNNVIQEYSEIFGLKFLSNFIYDENNNLIEKFYITLRDSHKTKYKYNNKGTLISKSEYNDKNALKEDTVYEYDSYGLCTKVIRKDYFKNEEKIYEFTYDYEFYENKVASMMEF